MGDQVAPEQEQPIELQVPLTQLELAGAPISVGHNPATGGKAIVVGPVAIQFFIPLDRDVARQLGSQLLGGIQVAHSMAIPKGRRRR